jgi:ethanolamine utilization cobalamin adenosyltransferase
MGVIDSLEAYILMQEVEEIEKLIDVLNEKINYVNNILAQEGMAYDVAV